MSIFSFPHRRPPPSPPVSSDRSPPPRPIYRHLSTHATTSAFTVTPQSKGTRATNRPHIAVYSRELNNSSTGQSSNAWPRPGSSSSTTHRGTFPLARSAPVPHSQLLSPSSVYPCTSNSPRRSSLLPAPPVICTSRLILRSQRPGRSPRKALAARGNPPKRSWHERMCEVRHEDFLETDNEGGSIH